MRSGSEYWNYRELLLIGDLDELEDDPAHTSISPLLLIHVHFDKSRESYLSKAFN